MIKISVETVYNFLLLIFKSKIRLLRKRPRICFLLFYGRCCLSTEVRARGTRTRWVTRMWRRSWPRLSHTSLTTCRRPSPPSWNTGRSLKPSVLSVSNRYAAYRISLSVGTDFSMGPNWIFLCVFFCSFVVFRKINRNKYFWIWIKRNAWILL